MKLANLIFTSVFLFSGISMAQSSRDTQSAGGTSRDATVDNYSEDSTGAAESMTANTPNADNERDRKTMKKTIKKGRTATQQYQTDESSRGTTYDNQSGSGTSSGKTGTDSESGTGSSTNY